VYQPAGAIGMLVGICRCSDRRQSTVDAYDNFFLPVSDMDRAIELLPVPVVCHLPSLVL